MTDINVVMIIGRLTKDPEVNHSQDGKSAWGTFSIASSERVKNGESWEDRPSYFEVKAGGPMYKGVVPYLQKGRQVAVSGSLTQDRWEKDGRQMSRVRIKADSIELLSSPSQQQTQSQPAQQRRPEPPKTNGPESFESSDFDDLPDF